MSPPLAVNPVTSYPAQLLAALSLPMVHIDPKGVILWANDAFARYCDIANTSFHGQRLAELCHFYAAKDVALDDADDECGLPIDLMDSSASNLMGCSRPRHGEYRACRPVRVERQHLKDGSLLIQFHDASEPTNLRQQLEHSRHRDELTGLHNRQMLTRMLQKIHARGEAYAVLLIDIDRFKIINDFYGQAQGDETLISLGHYIAEHLRAEDTLGRWSGHEFMCLLPGCDLAEARDRADTIRHHIRHGFRNDRHGTDQPGTITVSIGVAFRRTDEDHFEPIIARADAALYEAKRRGRNRVVTDLESGKSVFIASAEIESALHEDRLIPAYQPIIELASRQIVADESLARIQSKDGSLIPAGMFIEAASELQIAHRIDQSIAIQAIQRCARTIKAAPHTQPIRHFVNISTDLLRHPKRIEAILEAAQAAAMDCGMQCAITKPLVIEITERELVSDPREALDILRPFLDFGLEIAVDDFGSGYSSFLYLLDLPVTYLKIEGGLVKRMRHEPKARAIIQGIQSIANQLDLITIAEFIEDEETARILTDLGVDWGQGYLFGHPEVE